jgi:predicted amidohydrolase YtcJ
MSSMPVGGVRPLGDLSSDSAAQLVVRNARVHTGDPGRPAASAVAIRDGVFAVVGDDGDVAPFIGESTRILDALGRRVIPGLNDSHLHVIRGGLNYLMELRWDGVTSLRQALAMLRLQAENTPKGQWVRVVGGWTGDQFAEKRLPSIAELNVAAPDVPVFVLHLYQSALLNRAAVQAVGYTKESPNPPGGEIVRDRLGNPTGLLLAAPAATLLYATLAKGPTLDNDDQIGSTKHFLRELNRFGLTSAIDAAGGFQNFPENYAAVTELAKNGELTLRIAYHLFPQVPGQELDDLRRWIGMVKPGDGDEWLRCNGAGENLAWSPADFENFYEPRPQLASNAPGDLEAAVRLLLDNGWGFRLHATYDETIQMDLGVFDKIAADGGFPRGVPWFFDHGETVSEASLDRIAALGGAMSVQNRMMFQGRPFIERYGVERAATAPPILSMLSRGFVVAAGTDATRVSSYNPWLSLSWLVSGRTVGDIILSPAKNRVDRETALMMYTAAGANLTGEGEKKGQIKVGQYADLALLSADFFSVPESEISRIESLLTIVGGKVVYGVENYEGAAESIETIEPSWSPVARFGGFQRSRSGVRQATSLVEAALDSALQRQWREDAGYLQPVYEFGVDPSGPMFKSSSDPLGGCGDL